MSGGGLPGGAVERLAELTQVLGIHSRPMIAHGHHNAFALTQGLHFDGHTTCRVETLGIAQQVVHRSFDHGRPAFQIQLRLGFEMDKLIR
ncbi:hypothetical protein D3C75_1243360 [compost metagenome]